MKRNILIILNAMFFVLAVWALIIRVILPFIDTAKIFGVADTFKAFGFGSVFFVIAPAFFGWMILNILKQRWSSVLYVGNCCLLILAVIVLATGIILFLQAEESGLMAIATISVASALAGAGWMNSRLLKVFRAAE